MKTVLGTYLLRPAVREDAEAITELIVACDIEAFGKPDFFLADLLEMWESIPLATNTWVVTDESGALHGYGSVEEMGEGRLDAYNYVLPTSKGRGIGTVLVEATEARAREYVEDYKKRGITYEINNVVPGRNQAAFELLERRGYAFKRLYSRMETQIIEPPDPLQVPVGFEVRTFEEGDEHALYEAYRQSFQDSRSFHEKPFDEWWATKQGDPYDRDLWFLACIDGEVVGFLLGKNSPDCLWVDLLGVTRQARKKGIGEYLLKLFFRAAWPKGHRTIGLTVDTGSLTNANRLYERVGMHAVYELFMYELSI